MPLDPDNLSARIGIMETTLEGWGISFRYTPQKTYTFWKQRCKATEDAMKAYLTKLRSDEDYDTTKIIGRLEAMKLDVWKISTRACFLGKAADERCYDNHSGVNIASTSSPTDAVAVDATSKKDSDAKARELAKAAPCTCTNANFAIGNDVFLPKRIGYNRKRWRVHAVVGSNDPVAGFGTCGCCGRIRMHKYMLKNCDGRSPAVDIYFDDLLVADKQANPPYAGDAKQYHSWNSSASMSIVCST